MKKKSTAPRFPNVGDLAALRGREPLDAISVMLRWWPSMDEAAQSVRRYLPEGVELSERGVYAWRTRGIPRSRQTALMRALEDDFGVMVTFEDIERLTQDRLPHNVA